MRRLLTLYVLRLFLRFTNQPPFVARLKSSLLSCDDYLMQIHMPRVTDFFRIIALAFLQIISVLYPYSAELDDAFIRFEVYKLAGESAINSN